MTVFNEKGQELEALPENAAQETGGNLDKVATTTLTLSETLALMLRELQINNQILAQIAGISDQDLAAMRQDRNFPSGV